MSLGRKLMRLYFDLVYHRAYDLTTARLSPYRRSQDGCIDKLELRDGDRVLCVGEGTGNEIVRILSRNPNVHIAGVDVSPAALRTAGSKVCRQGKAIELCRMDAQELGFPGGIFDKAICLHVMGFLADDRKATAEIVRVLKPGAQFVVTYPTGNGLLKLGAEVVQSLGRKLRSRRWREAVRELAALVGAGVLNLPLSLWLKPAPGFYSRQKLEAMLTGLELRHCHLEEDKIYQEFIASGTKQDRKRSSHAVCGQRYITA